MKVAGFLLITVIFIMPISRYESVLADFVEIHGYVCDTKGNPVKGVFVIANSFAPPWVDYGYAITDAGGHYVLSFDRPKRLDVAQPSHKGLPIYEGCRIMVAWNSKEWLPITDHIISTENRSSIEQNFNLGPAGTVKLEAYGSNGTLIEEFPTGMDVEYPAFPAYTTDLYWRVTRGVFCHDRGTFMLDLNTPQVLNLPWTMPGFGHVILRADNGGEGFTLTRQGETITINLNYELARTECRLLKESYQKCLSEGYIFSKDVCLNIQSAWEVLLKANSMASDVHKAHFADLCLNRTLWAAESLELEKALQDIEKYRKGNAILQLVDGNGKPMDGVDIGATQITHDFLFGAALDGFLDLRAYGRFMEAGMNYGLLGLYWWNTERTLGQYNFNQNPPADVELLRNMGFHFGSQALIILEPGPQSWDTGLVNLSFEQLKSRIYEHVHKLVNTYSDYIDYWTIIGNPHYESDSLGFTREQMIDLIKAGVTAVKSADPTSKILIIFDDPGCDKAAIFYQAGDEYTLDPYTFFSCLDEYGIDRDGMVLCIEYGSLYEFPSVGTFGLFGLRVPHSFMDLASISRILDWYCTLSAPIHIQFHVPGNFTSNLGYWHSRSWDEALQAEWVEKFYTIAFSKPWMREITYFYALDEDYMKADRGLLNVSYFPRQSFYALKKLITEDWTTRLHMRTDANGQVEFRGFAGDYNITVSTKNFTANFTIHVNEQSSNTYTINLGGPIARSKAEQAVAQAGEVVSRAKAEGRTIYLDRAENLLEDARKALIEENYTQAILLAGEANRAANNAVTWLVVPATIVFALGILSITAILYRRVRAKRRKPAAA